MTPVLLSLAASCCWGVADFVGGLQSKRVEIPVVLAMVEGTGLVLVLVVIALITMVQVLFEIYRLIRRSSR